MFFFFKTLGKLQVIHQHLSRPKQIRAVEYAVGRKIGLERVNNQKLNPKYCTGKTARNTIANSKQTDG
jgi:hypothetical protein